MLFCSSLFANRVNFEAMQRFQGRQVLLVGEITGMNDGKMTVKTSDNSEVTVISNPSSGSFDDKFVEVGEKTEFGCLDI
jgi:hypothetical protein